MSHHPEKSQPNVMMYASPTCHFCHAEKEFLDQHGVKYVEYDVLADEVKAREMIDISGQMGTPVTIVGEGDDKKIIIGFDEPALTQALGL